MKLNKTDQIVWDCYRELFANSEPKGDFDKLVENATINKIGQKEIQFMDYEIEKDIFEEIVLKHQKKFREKWKQKAFGTEILLGCSPKFAVHGNVDKQKK